MNGFKIFGNLTALEPIPSLGSSKKIIWICKCQKKKSIRINHVTSGRIKTCGSCNLKDIEFWKQTKFGKLRMKEPESIHFNSGKVVVWICDCGREISISVIKVTSKIRTSCGSCNLKDIEFWKQTKFGKLRMKEPELIHLNSHKTMTWICDCGRETSHIVSNVTRGQVKSCGACNLIYLDQKFGHLIAKFPLTVKPGSNKKIIWICDCGREVNSKIYNVIRGHTRSCGSCNLKDIEFWKQTKFGKLQMKEPRLIHLNSHKTVTWVCNCGNETNSKISNVTNGITKSCGKCFETIYDWYTINRNIIKKLKTPIQPNEIPIGGIQALEIIKRKHISFLAICPICSRQYQPRWDMIRQGESITCGCTSNSSSTSQIEIFNFLKKFSPESELEFKIDKFKFDIGIPNFIVIEYHGLNWHSNQYSKKLDKIKYQTAIQKNYRYLLIYEDEWLDKKEIFQNLIKNLINYSGHKLRIQQCVIKQITNKETDPFYEQYHYIGKARAKVHYGVFYQNQLIAAISFSKPTRQTSKYDYELTRMCSHPNYHIHGIWSKLLKLFISEYNPMSIVSFSDNRLFTGKVYEKMGFVFDGNVRPDYYWVKNKKRFHKSKLRISQQSLTEIQLREKEGYKKIWDLGKKRWILILA